MPEDPGREEVSHRPRETGARKGFLMQTQNIRTAHGTVHRATIGRTYKIHGIPAVNRAGCPTSKADCGALTSTAAVIIAGPVTCPKCIARA